MSTDTAPVTASKTSKTKVIAIAAVIVAALAAGTTSGLRALVFEPQEEKAAFVEIASSSDSDLRAKSIDELVSLDTNVFQFSQHTPGMHYAGLDAADRVDRAIAAKRGNKL